MTTAERRKRHREQERRWFRRWYREAKAAGLCTRGCGGPADSGRASCAACRQYRKERDATR